MVTLVVALAGTVPATAQPAAPPAGDPVPTETASGTADSPELRAAYDRAFAALLGEDWAVAAAGFTDVAARSVEAERRGAAAELARFAREMDERSDKGPSRQAGRADFVVTTTLAAFYSSFALIDVLDIDDYKNETLFVTGTTLAGFGASLLLTRGRTITDSMAAAYGSGLAIGLGNGLLLAHPIGIDPDGHCSSDPLVGCPDGQINQNYLLFGLATMTAGGVAGTYLAYKFQPTAPQARFVTLMSVNGLVTAGLGMIIADADGLSDKTVLGLLALGLDAGVVGGAYLSRDLDWSSSRLTYVTLAEFLGGLTTIALAVVTLDERGSGSQPQVAGAMVLGGVWGGFALARYLTRDMKPHPRYRVAAPPPVAIMPLVTDRGAHGISLVGRF